jgi:hypothetical protein
MKMKKLEEILPHSQPSPQTIPRLAQLGHQGLPPPKLPPFAEKAKVGELLTKRRRKEFSKKQLYALERSWKDSRHAWN